MVVGIEVNAKHAGQQDTIRKIEAPQFHISKQFADYRLAAQLADRQTTHTAVLSVLRQVDPFQSSIYV